MSVKKYVVFRVAFIAPFWLLWTYLIYLLGDLVRPYLNEEFTTLMLGFGSVFVISFLFVKSREYYTDYDQLTKDDKRKADANR